VALGHATLLQSFNCAFEGLVHAFRYQRNMRIHIGLAFLVLVASLFFDLTRLELLSVFAAITLVLLAELFNSALEAAIDLFTDSYDPRAKAAKDMSAGAVLVSAIFSLVVAYFVFAEAAADLSGNILTAVRGAPSHLTLITLLIVILLVVTLKATVGRGRPLSGGLPSGHAALAFAAWTAVTFITAGTRNFVLVSALTFIMAVLTAQSRVESGVHSAVEVAMGAVLGVLVTALIFQLLY